MTKTVCVLITDIKYFEKAKVTIRDLRSVGKWQGDLVLITIDCQINEHYKNEENIINIQFPQIDKTQLIKEIGPNGFENSDKREIYKLNQWEKFHVFDNYFLSWDRVIYFDAGLRILDDINCILELDYKNKLLAPIDGKQLTIRPTDIFKYQIDHNDTNKLNKLINDFGIEIFEKNHMLNCMWIYDTNILKICNKQQLIDAMNKYTLCRTNEMGIMNLLFHFKYGLWEKFPAYTSNGKFLFEWCELNNDFPTTWKNYCFLKYPISISLNQRPN